VLDVEPGGVCATAALAATFDRGLSITCPQAASFARMMLEYQVRICERLGVKFPGPTRQKRL
jgi:hypothetical protein